MHHPSKFCAFLLLFACLGTPTQAQATIVERLDIQDMTEAAAVIAVGTIEDSSSRWTSDGYRIITEHTLRVDRLIKGEPGTTHVTFQVAGGTVGDLAQYIAGEATFETGEDVLVFLEQRPQGTLGVVGMSQGKYSVAIDIDTGVSQAVPQTANLKLAQMERVPQPDGTLSRRIIAIEEPQNTPARGVELDALIQNISKHL